VRDAPFHVSLAHSREVVVVAIAAARVGVDVEVVRPRRLLERLARRTLDADALASWCALPDGARLGAFVAAWTSKEAYLKAIGVGLVRPLRDVDAAPAGWTGLVLPDAVPGCVVAVAVEATAAGVEVREVVARVSRDAAAR
jgi:4'-phosphopantetheinyl transferase